MYARLLAWGNKSKSFGDRPGDERGDRAFAGCRCRPQLHLPRQWQKFSDRGSALHSRPAGPVPDEPEQPIMAADRQRLPASTSKPASNIAGMRSLAAFGTAVLVLLQLIAGAAQARDFRPGEFDYYVLALSWSPTYCASEAGASDGQQCAPGRRFAFVVHGLWPQFKQGWPENCETGGNTSVPGRQKSKQRLARERRAVR